MSWDSVPWFVGGGALHSPEVARLLAYAATSGEGILAPGDLKVSALAVPGSGVRVGPGAGIIFNRAAGGTSQSYVARNPTEDTVAIAATGSSGGRSDLIVARVEDPFMAGEPWQDPADPQVGPYIFTRVISNVPAGTTTVTDLNLGYSAIALARIDIPASTGTVTAAMVKDVRRLARSRRERTLFRHQPSSEYGLLNDWGHWPLWEPTFIVPEWATHVVAKMEAYGVLKPAGGLVIGDSRLEFCTPGTPGPSIGSVIFEEESAPQNRRTSFAVTGEMDVRAHRGKTRSIRIGARRNPVYSASDGTLRAVTSSNFVIDVEFQERAV